MKALSIRQPWAWLILHAGKTIENRSQAWTYRGPIAIHAPARIDTLALGEPSVRHAFAHADHEDRQYLPTSAIIGVADLIDAHHEIDGCCTPWGEPGAVHLVLANARPIEPISCRGHLDLWTPAPPILDQLPAQSPDSAATTSPAEPTEPDHPAGGG